MAANIHSQHSSRCDGPWPCPQVLGPVEAAAFAYLQVDKKTQQLIAQSDERRNVSSERTSLVSLLQWATGSQPSVAWPAGILGLDPGGLYAADSGFFAGGRGKGRSRRSAVLTARSSSASSAASSASSVSGSLSSSRGGGGGGGGEAGGAVSAASSSEAQGKSCHYSQCNLLFHEQSIRPLCRRKCGLHCRDQLPIAIRSSRSPGPRAAGQGLAGLRGLHALVSFDWMTLPVVYQ